MKDQYRPIYIILFIMIIIGGWLMINWKDTTFADAGWIYIVLAIAAMFIYYFAPRILKRK